MSEHPGGLIVFGCVVLYYVFRWTRVRKQLFRITEKADAVLNKHGLPAVDLFRSDTLRNSLSLAQIASRLEQRVDRLQAELRASERSVG